MPKCGDGEEEEPIGHQRCNVNCIPSIALDKARYIKQGLEDHFSGSRTVSDTNWDCPACGTDSGSDDGSDNAECIGGPGRTTKKQKCVDKAVRRARRAAKRYQPWTPYYICTVMLEKLVQLTSLGLYIYSDNYRWGLFKSFMFFALGVKSVFSLAEFIRCECERRQRCIEKGCRPK